MKRALLLSVSVLSMVLLSAPAHALPCSEAVNMLNVGVPANIVASAIKDSGAQYTQTDVACLQNAGAPAVVVDTARSMMAAAAPAPVAAPVVTPSRRSSAIDSDSDLIGSRAGSGRSSRDLSDGPGAAASATDPGAVKEMVKLLRAGKPLSASLRAYDMLQSGQYPSQTTKIKYFLGRSLQELEMYHTAQYFFLQVVDEGPSSPFFKYALPRLVRIASLTGDETELTKRVPRYSPEDYPRGSKNQMYYLMGLRKLAEEDLNSARKYFGQISPKSPLYLRSTYLEGIIYNKQGKLKSAKRAFMDIVRHPIEARNDREYALQNSLKDLALINTGRMYYKIERFDDATKYFNLVSHDSKYWPDALFSNAWSHFMQNNLNEALGQILTVQSPYYSDDDFIPELEYLRALTFFNLCEYKEVDKILLAFEDRMRPVQQEMKTFVKGYASKEKLKMADRAWDSYFGSRAVETYVPKAMFARMLRNQDLSGVVSHIGMMDDEVALIDEQKPQWRDTVGAQLKRVIEKDRIRYKRRAGKFMLAEMARWANTLQDLLTSSEIVRFEVIDAQRVDYQYKFQNPDISGLANKINLDFATAVEFIYWPFNGEFWKDELGYYHYTEQGSCK